MFCYRLQRGHHATHGPLSGTSAAITWSLTACDPVFHIDTAVPDELATFEPALVGTWVGPESERAVITSRQDSTYRIEFTDKDGDSAPFNARMGQLGEKTVLEFWPAFLDEDDDWPMGRMLAVLTVAEDEFGASSLNGDSLRAALANGVLQLPFLARFESGIMLTAPTAQLAPALSKYLARPGVLDQGGVWRRQPKE